MKCGLRNNQGLKSPTEHTEGPYPLQGCARTVEAMLLNSLYHSILLCERSYNDSLVFSIRRFSPQSLKLVSTRYEEC